MPYLRNIKIFKEFILSRLHNLYKLFVSLNWVFFGLAAVIYIITKDIVSAVAILIIAGFNHFVLIMLRRILGFILRRIKSKKQHNEEISNPIINLASDTPTVTTGSNSILPIHQPSPDISKEETPMTAVIEKPIELPAPEIKKIDDKLYDFVIFDIETTGVSKVNNEIIQISALKYKNDQKVAEFNYYIKPNTMPSKKIQFLTGISIDDLIDAPSIDEIITAFTTFIEDLPLIGHNIFSFDIPFIIANGFYKPTIEAIDTLPIARQKLLTDDFKLPTLKKYFNIDNRSHNSLNDCITNAIVYQNLRDDKLEGTLNEESEPTEILAGKRFCVTGEFIEMTRADIVELINHHGGRVTGSVSGLTNYLVLGTQIASNLSNGKMSSKEVKAHELIASGKNLQIIDLNAVLAMVE